MYMLILLTFCFKACLSANTRCWTVDQMTDQIMLEADKNGDGIMQMEELMREISHEWGIPDDGLSYNDFIKMWVRKYHDNHSTMHQFAVNMDHDKNGKIEPKDVVIIIIITKAADTAESRRLLATDDDTNVRKQDFNAVLHALHPVTHSHGAHGCH